jgi:hypothetical protein
VSAPTDGRAAPGPSRGLVACAPPKRYDGKGYPFVREGWTQHPVSRLASNADVFDAMTSRRAYARAVPVHQGLAFARDAMGRTCVLRLVRVLGRCAVPCGSPLAEVPA